MDESDAPDHPLANDETKLASQIAAQYAKPKTNERENSDEKFNIYRKVRSPCDRFCAHVSASHACSSRNLSPVLFACLRAQWLDEANDPNKKRRASSSSASGGSVLHEHLLEGEQNSKSGCCSSCVIQ